MAKLKITRKDLDYAITEALNSLKTNIYFSGEDIKVVMLTSCDENEGKSNVSFQLARSFAADKKKVMFIDCDMRKSVISNTFEIEPGQQVLGLSHYLSGQYNIDDVVSKTDENQFDVIVAGPTPPNTPSLLRNARFTKLIDYARENYDMVVVDCPPLGLVIDAAVIAPNCDGSIFLIESGHNSYNFAKEVKKQLEMTGCPILGVVLNKMPKQNSYGYYKKYYGDRDE